MKKTLMAAAMFIGSIAGAQAAWPTINSATCGIFDGYDGEAEYICEVSITSGAINRSNPSIPVTSTWTGISSVANLEDTIERFVPGLDVRGFARQSVFDRELANPTYDHRNEVPASDEPAIPTNASITPQVRGATCHNAGGNSVFLCDLDLLSGALGGDVWVEDLEVRGSTVQAVQDALDDRYPGYTIVRFHTGSDLIEAALAAAQETNDNAGPATGEFANPPAFDTNLHTVTPTIVSANCEFDGNSVTCDVRVDEPLMTRFGSSRIRTFFDANLGSGDPIVAFRSVFEAQFPSMSAIGWVNGSNLTTAANAARDQYWTAQRVEREQAERDRQAEIDAAAQAAADAATAAANAAQEAAGLRLEIVRDSRGNFTGYRFDGRDFPTSNHLATYLYNTYER